MNEIYERELSKELKRWIDRKEILAIKGPRQSGKTTLLELLKEWLEKERKVNPNNIIFLTFEDTEILEKFTWAPGDFVRSFVEKEGERYYFLLDEFHYVKDGGRKLKLLYDTQPNIKFVITGSSSLEIIALSKYLVGRVFSFHLFPFNFREFLNARDRRIARWHKKRSDAVRDFILKGKEFPLGKDIFLGDVLKLFDEYLVFGGYPEVVKGKNSETKRIILKNIYETYLGREVVKLPRIPDLFKFRKLVGLLSSQLGGLINYNQLASACNSYFKEITGHLNVLEETYVIKLVRPFYKNLRTELRKNPKVYFIDLGLRNYIINNFNPPEMRSDGGALVENYALLALFDLVKDFGKVNYWRTLSKAEVDFVLNLGEGVIPIEVKYSSLKEPKVSRSFRSFLDAYRPKRGVVLTRDFWGKSKISGTEVRFVPACYL
jgi:hypothetical protein